MADWGWEQPLVATPEGDSGVCRGQPTATTVSKTRCPLPTGDLEWLLHGVLCHCVLCHGPSWAGGRREQTVPRRKAASARVTPTFHLPPPAKAEPPGLQGLMWALGMDAGTATWRTPVLRGLSS